MTPMIDVVFQMIIFFIVTIKMEEHKNEDIELEDAHESPTYDGDNPQTLVVEVDQRGWLSINGAQATKSQIKHIIRQRYNRLGTFPVMIRADRRTKHKDVRKVMDICTDVGLWRIDFAATKEHKAHG
jgi:biopolymer transport protein ExbD